MKRILLVVLIFMLGAFTGGASLWLYYGESMNKTIKTAASLVKDAYASSLYTYEVNEADRQFLNKNQDISIYALDRAVRNLSSFQAPRFILCRETAYKLGKYNVRLARLYAERGNKQAQDEHLKKAIASYETMGWQLKNTDELTQAIPLIESEKTAEALKIYGKLITSCAGK